MLGKRPFSKGDDMDKWLDEHRPAERSAPPPLEEEPPSDSPEPAPAPVVAAVPIARRWFW